MDFMDMTGLIDVFSSPSCPPRPSQTGPCDRHISADIDAASQVIEKTAHTKAEKIDMLLLLCYTSLRDELRK